MSCDGCKELAEIKRLLQEIDLSEYLKKSDLAAECGNQREVVVTAIIPASAWPPVDVEPAIRKALGM